MPNPDIEEAIKKLREKQAAVETGNPPVAAGVQEPLRRDAFETQEQYAAAAEKLEELDELTDQDHEELDALRKENERLAKEHRQVHEWNDKLVQEHLDLIALLRRTAVHIAARNAMGEKSTEFCCACNNARHGECVLPEIYKAIG